jgi:crotonobetainyl-CoA:carnitine CoA-transferase CaiB-like acyl-CoA transferase
MGEALVVSMKPLDGVRILTIEQFGAAPYGTMCLAELGAEVIKVENGNTGGDPSRRVGPYLLGEQDSEYFQSWNLNKRSVTLDLKSTEGKAAFHRLVGSAAGVVNNLRGHLPSQLGITHADLRHVNPAIVCLHLSAYGRGHERESWPGYDFLMQAEAGLMSLAGEPDGPPARAGASVVDTLTGLTGMVGLLSGILHARATGTGCDVDTCLFDVALHQHLYVAAWYLNEGHQTQRLPRGAHASLAPVQTLCTRDGWVFVMCMTDEFWRLLCEGAQQHQLITDPRFASQESRRKNLGVLSAVLDQVFRQRTTAEWLETFNGIVPVAPINDLAGALDSQFVRKAGLVRTVLHPQRGELRVMAGPIKINGERLPQRACSALGADNAALLGDDPT